MCLRLWWRACSQADLWCWCLSCPMSRRYDIWKRSITVHLKQSHTDGAVLLLTSFLASSFFPFVLRCRWCTSWWGDTPATRSRSSLKRSWCFTVDFGGSGPLLSSLSTPQVVNRANMPHSIPPSQNNHFYNYPKELRVINGPIYTNGVNNYYCVLRANSNQHPACSWQWPLDDCQVFTHQLLCKIYLSI